MAQPVTVGGRLKFTVAGRVSGRVGRFAGAVSWTVEPPLLRLTPAADGLACIGLAQNAGDCVVTASAPGVNAATFAVSVLAADATDLVIAAEVMAS